MRLSFRAAGLLALTAAAITCTDAPTAPGGRSPLSSARLALSPGFSTSAERAYGALASMGIAVTQVRIQLRTADGRLARDTTIQFGTSDTLQLQLPVEIQGTEQTFSARIELMDATGLVLFAQTQDVVARASALPAAPSPAITLDYVGPGASARSISVSPADVTIQPGVAPELTALGADAAGAPVANLLLAWTSSDQAIATVTGAGAVATVQGTGRRGTVTITATLPTGIAGSARLAMLPAAARVAVISGADQTDMAGRTLAQPLVVELQGTDGGPIPGATLTFRPLGAGTVGTATAITDAAGRASTTLTLGRVSGTQIFEAAAAGVTPASVNMVATPIQAVALAIVSGNGQSDSTGNAGQGLLVRASDEFGLPVAGASITWDRLAGSGALGATSSTTGPDGIAGSAYIFGALPGTDTLRARIAGANGQAASVLFTTTALVRGVSAIDITSGGGQSGLPGASLPVPLVAVVTDALGHRLSGVSVQWRSSVAGLVSFATPVATTDANGEARTSVSLGTVAGSATVTATSGALSASTTISVAAGAAANLAAVGGSGAGIVGGTTLLTARVTDAAGNPVAGYPVTWSITAGGGTLPFASSTTNMLGDADITWTLGSLVGTQTATASANGLAGSPAVFTVNAVAGAGSLLRVATQPGAPTFNAPSGVVLATQPSVQLMDATGTTPIRQAGVIVAAALSDATATLRGTATATTDSSGLASFTGLNIVGTAGRSTAMVFSASNFTSTTSNPLAIGPGVAATMAALPYSTSGIVGLLLPVPPSVVVKDSAGNAVSGVPVAFTAAGGAITTSTTTTDASGTASVGGWILGIVGENLVTATSGTLSGSPVTFKASGTASAAQVGSIRLVRGAKQLLAIGGTLPADSVAFVVENADGLPLAGIPVTLQTGEFAPCSIPASVVSSDAKGIVSTSVAAKDVAGGCEVTARSGNTSASSKVAVYATGDTHVWFGGTIEVDRYFDVASNWLGVADGRESVPTSKDVAFVPYWETNLGPQLLSDVQLHGLRVDRRRDQYSTAVDLNGHALTTNGDLIAPSAWVANGLVIAAGANARVAGLFERLDVGRVDYCASDNALLDAVGAKELRVFCAATVTGSVSVDTVDAEGAADLSIARSATVAVNRGASLAGARLRVDGSLFVSGDALITAPAVEVTAGATVQLTGRATLGQRGGTVTFTDGSMLAISGDAIFDGAGTLSATQVSLSSNATFTGAGSWALPKGELQLYGSLDVRSGQGSVFTPSGDHRVRFVGGKAQTVTFAAGAGSFARASVENAGDWVTFKGPMSFTSDNAPLVLAPGARALMSGGPVDIANTIDVGKSATLDLGANASLRAGQLRLFDSATFSVQEGFSFAGACTRTINDILSVNVTTTGLGQINGKPVSALSCTP